MSTWGENHMHSIVKKKKLNKVGQQPLGRTCNFSPKFYQHEPEKKDVYLSYSNTLRCFPTSFRSFCAIGWCHLFGILCYRCQLIQKLIDSTKPQFLFYFLGVGEPFSVGQNLYSTAKDCTPSNESILKINQIVATHLNFHSFTFCMNCLIC